jgi:hypothetical protein
MTTQAPPMSQHLAAAEQLLGELTATIESGDPDTQTKAVTATAQAVLVLAEQVAAMRVVMVQDLVSRGVSAQPAPTDEPAPKKRGWW